MYVRVLGDDDPLKIMTYHVSWLPSGNTACTITTDNLLNQCRFLLPTMLYLWSTQHFFMLESSDKYYICCFIHTSYNVNYVETKHWYGSNAFYTDHLCSDNAILIISINLMKLFCIFIVYIT